MRRELFFGSESDAGRRGGALTGRAQNSLPPPFYSERNQSRNEKVHRGTRNYKQKSLAGNRIPSRALGRAKSSCVPKGDTFINVDKLARSLTALPLRDSSRAQEANQGKKSLEGTTGGRKDRARGRGEE